MLLVFLWLVKQDWCEAILEYMWGSTSLGRGGVFSELKEQSHSVSFLQNPGSSSAHIDVGQICCVSDDVFIITLIKRWKEKRRSTHRN